MNIKTIYKPIKRMLSFALFLLFFFLFYHYADVSSLSNLFRQAIQHPLLLGIGMVIYGCSFLLKAFAWKWYLQGHIRFSTAWIGIIYSLFINHLLPVKLGEFFRAYICKERCGLSYVSALQSVAIMRVFDLGALFIIAIIGVYWIPFPIRLSKGLLLFGILVGMIIVLSIVKWRHSFLQQQWIFFRKTFFRRSTIPIFVLILISWLMEGALVWTVVRAVNHSISPVKAIWINSITVVGQVFQMTPGGIASYEAVMSLAFRSVHYSIELGLNVAILTHALKFVFAYAIGIIVWFIHPISIRKMGRMFKKGGVHE